MSNKQGFTLLEVIIAVAIVSVGLISAFSLAVGDLHNTKENYGKVQAVHLAREGIELVRNIRDSNWLKFQANYDCDSSSGGLQHCEFDNNLNYDYIVIDYATNTPKSVCGGYTFDECLDDSDTVDTSHNICINDKDCDLFNVNNFFVHDSVTTTLSTDLFRAIRLNKICKDGATDEEYFKDGSDSCDIGDDKIGLEVTSRVRWKVGNDIDYLDVVASLYDWRY